MPTVSISLMLAVHNAAAAAEWYKRALGAEELWNFGGVVGLTACQWPVGGPRLWPIENPHFAGCF
jgi:catechol 2,3-dioxygenase-like lactoylglutathione lyase family enzyme